MLKLKGNDRVKAILAIILLGGIIYLYQPVLVAQVLKTGIFAIILVLLLWFAQWNYEKMPQLRKNLAIRRQKASEKILKASQKPVNKDEQSNSNGPSEDKK